MLNNAHKIKFNNIYFFIIIIIWDFKRLNISTFTIPVAEHP